MIGHILFKFVLYNNYNYDFKKGELRVRKDTVARVCALSAACGTTTAALLMSASVAFFYDKGTNYFVPDALLFRFAVIFALLAFAAAIANAIIIPKDSFTSRSPFGANLLVALPASLGFAIGGIFLAINFIQSRSYLVLAAAVALLLSMLHALLCEAGYRIKALGFFPSVACALLVCILYFDASMEMNAPLKVAAQCALLPLMLYFTAELRYLLDCALPRLYLALALGSVALSSLCTLAIPVAVVAGFLDNANCLAAALVVLGANITILFRLKRFLTPIPAPDENDTKETDAQ